MDERLPLLDVSHLSNYLSKTSYTIDEFRSDPIIQQLSATLAQTLNEWGFLYLTGHGIQKEVINGAFSEAARFFQHEKRDKELFVRNPAEGNAGYVPFKFETFEKHRPFDLKECFQFQLSTFPKPNQLERLLPGFMRKQSAFFEACIEFTVLLLKLIGCHVTPNDIEFFSTRHNFGNNEKNPTTLRLLNYPSIFEDLAQNQLRCGEHSDYGTITLLFQDDAGGLQVVSPSGKYVDVKPIDGSIILNSGDLLEVWTSGKFKSTRHRVIVENHSQKVRQSLAFFVHPDNGVTVECLDGSNKYKSCVAEEYLQMKLKNSYQ